MLESQTFFTRMVDELVEFSEHDPELKDGIKWLDEQAQEKEISFYDIASTEQQKIKTTDPVTITFFNRYFNGEALREDLNIKIGEHDGI